MAIQNKGQIGTAVTSLIAAIATSFPNNTAKLITPAILRNWLTSLTAILTSVNDSENNVGEIYTKAAAETKRAAGGLTPNQFYFISDATGAGTKVIAILASAANAFHTSAINLTDGSFGAYVLGTDVFTAVGGGGPFQKTDITLTKAELATAISAATIDVNRNYIISDGLVSGDKLIRILPSSANSFYINCENLTDNKLGRYTIATDWFIPVDNIYEFAPTTAEDSTKGYVVGDLYLVGGTTYQVTDVTAGAAVWGIIFINEASTFSGAGAGGGNTGNAVNQLGNFAGTGNIGNRVNQIGINAGESNTGSDVNQLGAFAGRVNTGSNVNQLGANAGRSNTGNRVNQFGINAGKSNTGSDVNQIGINAGENNAGSDVNQLGANAGVSNAGSDVNQLGANAGRSNTGNRVNQFGINAGKSNTGSDVNQIGINAGENNAGSDVNQLGNFAGTSNVGSDVNQFGRNAGTGNAGNDVNQFGRNAGTGNVKPGGQFFGPDAGNDGVLGTGYTGADNVFAISNQSIAQFADRSTATTAMTVANGYPAGSTYIYCNLATNSIEYVRL